MLVPVVICLTYFLVFTMADTLSQRSGTRAQLRTGSDGFLTFDDLPLRPYPYFNGSTRSTPLPGSQLSPDPLVNAIWSNETANDVFQLYTLYPQKIVASSPSSAFEGLDSLLGGPGNLTVLGSGRLVVDFGVESAGWIEFVSDDMPESVQITLSLSEDSKEYPGKILEPVPYDDGIYRLETNECAFLLSLSHVDAQAKESTLIIMLYFVAVLYEGVRFGFVNIVPPSSACFHIQEIRAVAQTLPVPYLGSFQSEDRLTEIWYSGGMLHHIIIHFVHHEP